MDKLIILESVVDNPGIYLDEIREKLIEETGTEVDRSTICRFISTSRFTHKKLTITVKQQSDVLRCQCLLDISIYHNHPEFFVFVDETGTDRRDSMRKFGYSLRDKPAVSC